MSYAINVEVRFFLISVLWGALILLAYDVLRILRRLIKHNNFFVAVQDLLFWVTASMFIFAMMYRENDGIIRGFCIMGMSIGMVLYHYILSNYFVTLVTAILKTLIKPVVTAINLVKKGIRFLFRKLRQLIKFLGRQLKNRTKSVKIAIAEKKQRSAEQRRKNQQHKAEKQKKHVVKKQKKKLEISS